MSNKEHASRTASPNFAPFTINTGGLTTYNSEDPELDRLCEYAARTAFPSYDQMDGPQRGSCKAVSGRVIGTIVRLADPEFAKTSRGRETIELAEQGGFEVYPGQGVTLADPDQVVASLPNLPNLGKQSVNFLINFASGQELQQG